MIARTLLVLLLVVTTGCFAKRSVPTSEQERIYTVAKGDTLERIATRAGLSVEEISEYNEIRNPKSLKVGQIVKIPAVGPLDQESLMHAALRDTGARTIRISHVRNYVFRCTVPSTPQSLDGAASDFMRELTLGHLRELPYTPHTTVSSFSKVARTETTVVSL